MEVPCAILGVAGVTAMETRCTVVTVNPVVPLTAPNVAVMIVLPFAALVASPCALIVAVEGFDEFQTTVEVTS
jgi:hypothetical protein